MAEEEQGNEPGIIVGRIVIERVITDDGDMVRHSAVDGMGHKLPVIEQLGMLSLVEDAVLHSPPRDE